MVCQTTNKIKKEEDATLLKQIEIEICNLIVF